MVFLYLLFIFGKTSNSTKIVCEIANSLQKEVVHQDSNLTQKFGLRWVFCFLAYQAGKSASPPPINALMFSSCNDLQGMGCSTCSCSAWSPGQFDLRAFLSLVVYLKHAILCGQNPVIMIHA